MPTFVRLTNEKKYSVMDTETTGLKSDDEMVQLCVLDQDGIVLIDTLFKPSEPIPAEVSAIHGITNDMVADAPLFTDLYPVIKEIMLRAVVCIYNADFDNRIFDQTCSKYRLPFIEYKSVCIMKAYTARRLTTKWFNLAAACQNEGVALNNAHSALGDTTATLNLTKIMMSKGK